MVFKETLLTAIDNSGANIVKTIQVYMSSTPYTHFLGKSLKVTLYKRRRKLKRVLVKRVFYMALIVHQKKTFSRLNGHYLKSNLLRVVLFSLTNQLLGSRLYGPICSELRLNKSSELLLLITRRFI